MRNSLRSCIASLFFEALPPAIASIPVTQCSIDAAGYESESRGYACFVEFSK